MFLSPLYYPNVTNFSFAASFCQPLVASISPAMNWIAFGKLPENPIITPSASTQVVMPSGIDRFLQTVTVKPIPTTPTP